MEPDRFDAWTRRLAASTPRRTLLRGAAGLAGAALARVAAGPAAAQEGGQNRVTVCFKERTLTIPRRALDALLRRGAVVAPEPDINGRGYDNNNCGACGRKCDTAIAQSCCGSSCCHDSREVCVDGACVCANRTAGNGQCCEWWQMPCPNGCFAFHTDPNNCGGCGISCPTGVCANDWCTCTKHEDCPASQACRLPADGTTGGCYQPV
ncbi:MAG: hypothetical protein QOF01_2549 [Thermomicrobiales bacterium]|jgi:hypothetical protein|nr:hypothetical protein [Thermomicrobiales bacterium]